MDYVRKYWDGEKKSDLEILRALHVLISTEYEKMVFGISFVCMCMHVMSEWFHAFVFDMKEFSHHESVPTEYKHSNSKNNGPLDACQNTK